MNIKLFGYVVTIEKEISVDEKALALFNATYNEGASTKITMIKVIRQMYPELGLRESKIVAESLFIFPSLTGTTPVIKRKK